MLPIIETAVLEIPRTQSELNEYVCSILDEFCSTDKGKEAIRFNRGDNIKEFKEELIPLNILANAFFVSEACIRFQLVKGNQSFDAKILNSKNEIIEYLQITQSDMNYQSHLQMIHLTEYGRAPRYGTPLKKDNNGAILYKECQTGSADDIVKIELGKIHAAVERKSNMGYEQNTSLVVKFSGELFCRSEDITLLSEFAINNLVPLLSQYNNLYLVSGQKGHDYKYKIKAA